MTTHYRQLTQCQCYQIEAGLGAGRSQACIAKRIGVAPSTISLQVRRTVFRSSTRRILLVIEVVSDQKSTHAGVGNSGKVYEVFNFGNTSQQHYSTLEQRDLAARTTGQPKVANAPIVPSVSL